MRKKRAIKRDVLPDPIYNSKLITKLINQIMNDGKRGTAEKIFSEAFEIIEKTSGEKAIDIFGKALENIKPILEVKSRRVGGSTYQVPQEVNPDRSQTLALRWLVNYAKTGNSKGMALNLANEIMDAAKGIGRSVKKREDIHKMAEANKAFAHYKW